MNAIAAADRRWGIGRDNQLLTHLSGDLKYFKEKTIGNTIIIGRKTLESFPGGRPLPGRRNIVLSADPAFAPEGCTVCRSKREVLESIAETDPDTVFVCGGASVYRLFLEDCRRFLLTRIEDTFEADAFLPDLEEEGFSRVWASEDMEEHGVRYRFEEYIRKGAEETEGSRDE